MERIIALIRPCYKCVLLWLDQSSPSTFYEQTYESACKYGYQNGYHNSGDVIADLHRNNLCKIPTQQTRQCHGYKDAEDIKSSVTKKYITRNTASKIGCSVLFDD